MLLLPQTRPRCSVAVYSQHANCGELNSDTNMKTTMCTSHIMTINHRLWVLLASTSQFPPAFPHIIFFSSPFALRPTHSSTSCCSQESRTCCQLLAWWHESIWKCSGDDIEHMGAWIAGRELCGDHTLSLEAREQPQCSENGREIWIRTDIIKFRKAELKG